MPSSIDTTGPLQDPARPSRRRADTMTIAPTDRRCARVSPYGDVRATWGCVATEALIAAGPAYSSSTGLRRREGLQRHREGPTPSRGRVASGVSQHLAVIGMCSARPEPASPPPPDENLANGRPSPPRRPGRLD